MVRPFPPEIVRYSMGKGSKFYPVTVSGCFVFFQKYHKFV